VPSDSSRTVALWFCILDFTDHIQQQQQQQQQQKKMLFTAHFGDANLTL
jgi:hypothetical protein